MNTQQNRLTAAFLKFIAACFLLAGITLSFSLTTKAAAFPDQTFVSGHGTDVGDCSDVSNPCKTVQYAIDQTFSSSIVTIVESGVYAPFTIKTSVTVEAVSGVSATILTTSGPAVTISIDPASSTFGSVVLRGLSFKSRGGNIGVHALSCRNLVVENCTFYVFPAQSLLYEAGSSLSNGDNILFVTDSRFIAGSSGLEIGTTANSLFRKAVVDNCEFKTTGLTVRGNTNATVSNSVSSAAVGFRSFGDAGFTNEMNIDRCVASNGSNGVRTFGTGALIRLSNSTVTGNAQNGVGGNVISRGNNTVEGNTINGSFAGTYLAK